MRDNVVVTGQRIRRDRDEVIDFCAAEIIEAALRFHDVASDTLLGRKMTTRELQGAAIHMSLRLVERMQEFEAAPLSVGYVAEEDGPELIAAAFLQIGESKRSRKRVLAQTLSHHIMRSQVAPRLYGAESVICRDLDGYMVRERIAEHVQRILVD